MHLLNSANYTAYIKLVEYINTFKVKIIKLSFKREYIQNSYILASKIYIQRLNY